MRYLLTVSYDGSKYYGFQKLNNQRTVQNELEKALTKINKKQVYVKGSGRTDRGVHAIGQRCHFDMDINIEPNRLVNAVNSLLDDYIYVKDCVIVDNEFHSRFLVKEKTYKYIINLGEFDPIKNDYVYNYFRKLNVDKMIEASKFLIGKHNYHVFVSGDRDNYNSEIFDIKFEICDNYIIIKFIGKSFYRYMVRNLVGALMLVGKDKITIEEFKSMIDSDSTKYTYITVPANGLYLESVKY